MSSSIFFKFKSMKDPLQITFDGTSLSVFEVKREIIAIARLGDGSDFDLEIYTPESNEEYDDDTTQIPRSTTVIARRTPAQKPGAGRAARYVTGKMPITAKNQHRVEKTTITALSSSGAGAAGEIGAASGGKEMSEEEKLNAMFAADTGAWKAEQAQMANKPAVRSNFKPAAVPDKPPPPGYTCFRCGQKGHWIQACPTNNDPNWDRRFKKTTGIPSSMLHKVEKVLDADGKPDFSKLPSGVMVNANGDWMVSAPDKAAWDKFQEKQKAAADKTKEASADNQELMDRGLQCPLDKHVLSDPVKTPCCGKTFCRVCIENALLDGDLLCPECGEQVLLDKLEPDVEVLEKIKQYDEEKKTERQTKEHSKSPAATAAAAAAASPNGDVTTPKPEDRAATPATVDIPQEQNNDTKPASSPSNPRKRTADEELENDRQGAVPAEMQDSTSQLDTLASASAAAVPTGPKALQPKATPTPLEEFNRQMIAMQSSMSQMQNGMPAMMNPMMGMPMNPMMMMPGMVNPMMNMGGFGGMNGMGMFGPGGGMNMGGMGNGGPDAWNGNQGEGNWTGPSQQQYQHFQNQHYAGAGSNNNNNGAYFRQPVNPNRQQGRQRRQRSVDYKQM